MKISIIMPVFNVAYHINFFKEALSGIYNQTYNNWELIVACDGQYQKTIDLVSKYLHFFDPKKSRYKLFYSQNIMGPGILRNMMVPYASGELLTFHDSDDFSVPERFGNLVGQISDKFMIGSSVMVNTVEKGKINGGRLKRYKGFTLNSLLESKKVRAPFHFPSVLIKKDFFEKFGGFEKYRYSSDSIFAIKLSYYMEMMGMQNNFLLDEPLFHWNRHPNSITTKRENEYKVRKCQKKQRKPLIKVFRPLILENGFDANEDSIFEALGIKNNLENLNNLIEI